MAKAPPPRPLPSAAAAAAPRLYQACSSAISLSRRRGRALPGALLLALACTLSLRADVNGETTKAPEGTV